MNDTVNEPRRQFLLLATSAVGVAGAAGLVTPFVASWQPSARARAAGAPVRIRVSDMAVDTVLAVEWRGAPVYVFRRSQETLKALETLDESLADPASLRSSQPEDAGNPWRSVDPEYLVVRAVCTHLGCAPRYQGPEAPPDGEAWQGGFFCPCHGSKFDLAGRVFKGVPAPTNLEVPPYYFDQEGIMVIGINDPEGQA